MKNSVYEEQWIVYATHLWRKQPTAIPNSQTLVKIQILVILTDNRHWL